MTNDTNHFEIIGRFDFFTTPHRAAAHWNARQPIARADWLTEYQQRFITPLAW